MRAIRGTVLAALPIWAFGAQPEPTLEFEILSTVPVHQVTVTVSADGGRVEIMSGAARWSDGVVHVVTPARIRVTGESEVQVQAAEHEPWLHMIYDGPNAVSEAWGPRLGITFDGSYWRLSGAATRSHIGGQRL